MNLTIRHISTSFLSVSMYKVFSDNISGALPTCTLWKLADIRSYLAEIYYIHGL